MIETLFAVLLITNGSIINELYMLVEWLSKTQEELRTHVNKEIPEIAKLNMQIQFIEERMIDVEMLLDKIRQNGISHD